MVTTARQLAGLGWVSQFALTVLRSATRANGTLCIFVAIRDATTIHTATINSTRSDAESPASVGIFASVSALSGCVNALYQFVEILAKGSGMSRMVESKMVQHHVGIARTFGHLALHIRSRFFLQWRVIYAHADPALSVAVQREPFATKGGITLPGTFQGCLG